MADPTKMLLTAANTLTLADEVRLLMAIAKAVKNFDKLKVKVASLADAEDLLHRIAAELDSAEVAQAFEDLGLKDVHDDLSRLVGKVVAADQKLSPKFKALLKPLGAFQSDNQADVVDWSLATPDKPAIKTGALTLNLGAHAGIAFDPFAPWPGQPGRLMTIGAQGAVTGSANLMKPFGRGPLTAEAGASVTPALTYYFAPAGDPLFAEAVATRILRLPGPFDFESLWEGFHDADLALSGVIYAVTGEAHGKVNVAFADPIALSVGVVGGLDVQVGVTASLKSDYELRLRKTATGVSAVLSREKVTDSAFSLQATFEADLSKVAEPAVKAVQKLVDQWDKALAEIKPYLSPGTLLRGKAFDALKARVGVLVHDDTLREAILADAKGALGLGPVDEAAVIGWLQDKVLGAIDKHAVLVEGQIETATQKVLQDLKAALPVFDANDSAQQLEDLVRRHIQAAEDSLTEAVKTIFAKPAGEVRQALEAAGVKVSGAVASADALLKPVRDLLAKYNGLVHEILTQVERRAKEKAKARLFVEESRHDQTVVEVAGEFTKLTPETAHVFAALVRGTLRPLVKLIEGARPDGFALDEAASSISRFSEFKSTQGLEVAFLGVQLSLKEFVQANALVKLDGDGDIHVATKQTMEKTLSLLGDREVSFVGAHALVLAKAMRDSGAHGQPSLSIGVGAAYSEKSLEVKDAQQFAGSLAAAGLLSGAGRDGVVAALDAWEDAAPGGKVRADIAANLTLSGAQAEALMRLTERDADGLTRAARLAVIEAALARQAGTFNAVDYAHGLQHARTAWVVGQPPASEAEIILGHRKGIGPIALAPIQGDDPPGEQGPASAGTAQADFNVFLWRAFGLLRLVDLIDAMGDIYTAVPSVDGSAGWDQAKYLARGKDMAQDSKYQLTVAKDVAGLFTARLTPRTLAFMQTLADLAGPDADGKRAGVTVTLTDRTKPESEALKFQ